MRKYMLIVLVVLLFSPELGQCADQTIVEEKYLPRFEKIEVDAVTKLNTLIDEAYIAYTKKKEKGEMTLPILLTYLERGRRLESEIDLSFQKLLAEMRVEISSLGLSSELVADYEQHYVKSKRKNKLQILKSITLEGHDISFE